MQRPERESMVLPRTMSENRDEGGVSAVWLASTRAVLSPGARSAGHVCPRFATETTHW